MDKTLEEGCCSAITPCTWQRLDPTTICPICRDAASFAELSKRLIEAEAALQDIINPLAALEREAQKTGGRLSGMAYQITKDPEHLKRIAKDYFARFPNV